MFSVLVATATLIDGFAAGLYVGLKLKNVNLKKTVVEVVKEVQADVKQIEQTVAAAVQTTAQPQTQLMQHTVADAWKTPIK